MHRRCGAAPPKFDTECRPAPRSGRRSVHRVLCMVWRFQSFASFLKKGVHVGENVNVFFRFWNALKRVWVCSYSPFSSGRSLYCRRLSGLINLECRTSSPEHVLLIQENWTNLSVQAIPPGVLGRGESRTGGREGKARKNRSFLPHSTPELFYF